MTELEIIQAYKERTRYLGYVKVRQSNNGNWIISRITDKNKYIHVFSKTGEFITRDLHPAKFYENEVVVMKYTSKATGAEILFEPDIQVEIPHNGGGYHMSWRCLKGCHTGFLNAKRYFGAYNYHTWHFGTDVLPATPFEKSEYLRIKNSSIEYKNLNKL